MKKRITSLFLLIVTVLAGSTSVTYANEPLADLTDYSPEIYTVGESFNEKGEVLEWRYMTFQGVQYKRRWSVTNNCWYDPYWIPV